MQKSKYIVFATGGTGGHFFPAKALVDAWLKDNNHIPVTVFLDQRAYKYNYVWSVEVNLQKLTVLPMKKVNFFKFMFYLKLSTFRVLWQFITHRPAVIVAFGGYTTLPVLIAGWLCKIPIILHEQNKVLGKTHRLFAKYAKKLLLTFPNTHYVNPQDINCATIGLPVREEFVALKQSSQGTQDSNTRSFDGYFNILILGGSMGASVFNDIITQAISKFSTEEQKYISITHQCREEDISKLLDLWSSTYVEKLVVRSFYVDLYKFIRSADLVISRAGASTMMEVANSLKHAIYVPYPYATDNHQFYNAMHALEAFGADVIKQEDLTVDLLFSYLQEYVHDQQLLTAKSTLIEKNLIFNTNEMFINYIKEYTN